MLKRKWGFSKAVRGTRQGDPMCVREEREGVAGVLAADCAGRSSEGRDSEVVRMRMN